MKNKERDIRIVFSIFSGIIAVFAWKSYPSISAYILYSVSLLLLLTIIFAPLSLQPLFQLWLKAAHFAGKVNTQILLTILFIAVIIPSGILMRILGKDPMKRKILSNDSYWQSYELEGLKDKARYERQF